MSGKRPISLGDEKGLSTCPSSPRQAATSNPYRQQHASDYDLELAGDETDETERQRLLPSGRGCLGSGPSKAYCDGVEVGDLYLAEEANVSLPRSPRKMLGSAKRPRRRIAALAALLAVILLGGYFGSSFFSVKPPSSEKESLGDPNILMSNGTHNYQKTVLVVSIDGLRSVIYRCPAQYDLLNTKNSADYLDRGLTPHLLNISKRGVRAEWMKPTFPSLTFPNHWTLMTGLHPESHGIVGNSFYDPAMDKVFVYTDPTRSHAGYWWGGEPVSIPEIIPCRVS
jgi:hypothetical protein